LKAVGPLLDEVDALGVLGEAAASKVKLNSAWSLSKRYWGVAQSSLTLDKRTAG
jgi:hypothetical protein